MLFLPHVSIRVTIDCYMRHMSRSRILTAALALLAGLATPGLALAHGVSHTREAHGSARHDEDHHLPDANPSEGAATLHAADGHAHPILQVATTKRISNDSIALASHTVVFMPEFHTRVLSLLAVERTWGGTDRATGPPPRVRAPPFL